MKTPASKGCLVIRVTVKHDVSTKEGLAYVLEAIRVNRRTVNNSARRVVLHAAIPCTTGSAWQRLNATRPGGAEKLAKTLAVFDRI